MYVLSVNEFKLRSGLIIQAGSCAVITPFNVTTANVKFDQTIYNVNMTDLHRWFDEFKTLDLQDLETSDYKDGWPVVILPKNIF